MATLDIGNDVRIYNGSIGTIIEVLDEMTYKVMLRSGRIKTVTEEDVIDVFKLEIENQIWL